MQTVQTRVQFLKTLGCGALAFGCGSVLARAKNETVTHVRVVPIAGISYPPAFLEFCRTRRFDSVRHALLSVRDRELEFDLEFVEEEAGL
jgi:hypothetical protein